MVLGAVFSRPWEERIKWQPADRVGYETTAGLRGWWQSGVAGKSAMPD